MQLSSLSARNPLGCKRMRLSKIFKLGRTQAELDFVDIDPSKDTPLFLDPHLLARRVDRWSVTATSTLRSFFQYFLSLISQGRLDEAEELFDYLHEPNETCLGLSRGKPKGNGIGDGDARKIFESIIASKAAKTGILDDLEDVQIFVNGVGKDKTSDMTTNIIRRHLLEYTRNQAMLWGIPLRGNTPTGFYWNASVRAWEADVCENLYVHDQRLLLVPKAMVSYARYYSASYYHRHFVLNFHQHDHLRLRSALVQRRTLRDGSTHEFVTKVSIVRNGDAPFDKDYLATFTKAHPDVFARFKMSDRGHETSGVAGQDPVSLRDVGRHLEEFLRDVLPGPSEATKYHKAIVGILEYLFFPALINPYVEREIHDGRKRIDIVFDNAAVTGFFHRLHAVSKIPCSFVFVECKNYSRDIANPELDQLAGRFSPNRGQCGLAICRSVENMDLLLSRCRDTFQDRRGLILPLTDGDLVNGLRARAAGESDPLSDLLSERYRDVALG